MKPLTKLIIEVEENADDHSSWRYPLRVRAIAYTGKELTDIREVCCENENQKVHNAVRRISRLMLHAK